MVLSFRESPQNLGDRTAGNISPACPGRSSSAPGRVFLHRAARNTKAMAPAGARQGAGPRGLIQLEGSLVGMGRGGAVRVGAGVPDPHSACVYTHAR